MCKKSHFCAIECDVVSPYDDKKRHDDKTTLSSKKVRYNLPDFFSGNVVSAQMKNVIQVWSLYHVFAWIS